MADYRSDAKRALERAKRELNASDDERLRYAALELRMVIEALTYERVLSYKDDLPPAELGTWQPKRVMAFLLDVDPSADQDRGILVRTDPIDSDAPEVLLLSGTEKVLNMSEIKRHYDALGNYIHVPTIKQLESGAELDRARWRARCEKLSVYLTDVLASRVWNVNIREFTSFDCKKCGKSIQKRLPRGQLEVDATCFECGATYKLEDVGENRVQIKSLGMDVKCGNPDCKATFPVWLSEQPSPRSFSPRFAPHG